MIYTDVNPISIAVETLHGILRIDLENFNYLISELQRKTDCTLGYATRAATVGAIVNLVHTVDFDLPVIETAKIKEGSWVSLMIQSNGQWVSAVGQVTGIYPVELDGRKTSFVNIENAQGEFSGYLETVIVLDPSDTRSLPTATQAAPQVDHKAFLRLAKASILKCLTEDFTHGQDKHNQAIFDAKHGFACFSDTDLEMVMGKVVLGLYLALNETQGKRT